MGLFFMTEEEMREGFDPVVKAKGLYAPLEPAGDAAATMICPKCGGKFGNPEYHGGGFHSDCRCGGWQMRNHLCRVCTGCGALLLAPPLDAGMS